MDDKINTNGINQNEQRKQNYKRSDNDNNNNDNYINNDIFDVYDEINCVHIGNKAAISGVTRFMTPSFDQEFRFSKEEQISKEQYAYLKDPCHIYQEMYSKICTKHNDDDNIDGNDDNDNNDNNNIDDKDKWDDEIYDEEYFEQRDDYLNEGEDNKTKSTSISSECHSNIDYRYPTIEGFDYLITEYSSVPGYYLLPNGVIYGTKQGIGLKSKIINMINAVISIFVSTGNNDFLEPTLYVLKRETQYNPQNY